MKSNCLYTLGYEGLTLDAFLDQLKQNNIQYLLDIREKPISRKKGFSKNKLAEALLSQGIVYFHFPDLGSPANLRKKVREDGDLFFFFEEYKNHLSAKKQILEEVLEIIQNGICCLLCFEKDKEKCHRKMVAEEIKFMNEGKINLKHLYF